MFVGFIAVIVIILIIVTLMSTGATNGSGGVDQTKATKVIGEISTLGQAIGFYKTMTSKSNYEGISVDNLVKSGIINLNDLADSTETMSEIDVSLGEPSDIIPLVSGTKNLIASKAIKGIYYKVIPHSESKNLFRISVIIDTSINGLSPIGGSDDGLRRALENSYENLSINATVESTVPGKEELDGIAIISFE